MDDLDNWIDPESRGSEIFKDVEIRYEKDDPMIKALQGSDVKKHARVADNNTIL